MRKPDTVIHDILECAIMTGLMEAYSITVHGMELEEIMPQDFDGEIDPHEELRAEIIKGITDCGIDPARLADIVTVALCKLLTDNDFERDLVRRNAEGLWEILGDPKQGKKPPKIYYRAAYALHLSYIHLLSTQFFNLHFRKST